MTTSSFNETELIQRARNGDMQSFATLVLTHQTFVYNLALRATGNAEEAQDMAQEAFLRAWTALPGFRETARFRTWLYRIVMNLCYSQYPRLRRELTTLPVEELQDWLGEEHSDLQAGLERQEQRSFLYRQIERLPASYRLMVMLRYQQDLSYDEIAQVLGVPLGTVKTGLFRAHAQLRNALQTREEVLDGR